MPVTVIAAQQDNKIEFNQPEKFTDFTSEANRNASDRNRLMQQLTQLMLESMKNYSHYSFEIVLNDIDMPGRFWLQNKHPTNEMIRIITDTDRTSIEFSYRLLDASGKVVQQGDAHLNDRNPLDYKRQLRQYKNTYFSNEMRLFNAWLKQLK